MPESTYDDSTDRYQHRMLGEGRRKRCRTSLKISTRCSRRRNRRTRYATGPDGKGGSLSREGKAIVQIRGEVVARIELGLKTKGNECQLSHKAVDLKRRREAPVN